MKYRVYFFSIVFLSFGCRKDQIDVNAIVTPYQIEYPTVLDAFLPKFEIPVDNPMTVQGVELGRELFYETLLSSDNTQSCSSCHLLGKSFSDTVDFSIGVTGAIGDRNAMPLFNLGWGTSFFWDGRSLTLEEQALKPVTNPIEMNNTWENAVEALQATSKYPNLFKAAFGTKKIDSILVAKALAQFERTLLSANSPFDKGFFNEQIGFTEAEQALLIEGESIFVDEGRGGCMHCHGGVGNYLFMDNKFHNNGLDMIPADSGLAAITEDIGDLGKFKTPSTRNLVFTAPYMHDGRFNTLEEVVSHYSSGVQVSVHLDPNIHINSDGSPLMSPMEEQALVFFLKSLSDSDFISNPDFKKP